MRQDEAQLVYIIGAGGHGRELHSYVEDLRRTGWRGELRGYLDDGVPPGLHGLLKVLGPIAGLADLSGQYITALGSNVVRRDVVERIAARYRDTLRPWTLLHPRSYVGEDVDIGGGTFIAPGAIVTANVRIGRHCIVNVKGSIAHDCTISDFVNINPGAAICGSVSIGEGAYIGAGAVVKDNIFIGPWSVIAAGAVVIRDVPPQVTVVGVPARPLRQG